MSTDAISSSPRLEGFWRPRLLAIGLLTGLGVVACAPVAQQPTPAPAVAQGLASAQVAERLVELTAMEDHICGFVHRFARGGLRRHPSYRARAQRLGEFLRRHYSPLVVEGVLTGFYRREFAVEEQRQLVEFYTSPLGRKFNGAVQQLMAFAAPQDLPGMPDELVAWDTLGALMRFSGDRFASPLSKELEATVVSFYGGEFTPDELQLLARFFQSPLGFKLDAKQQLLAQELKLAFATQMQRHRDELRRIVAGPEDIRPEAIRPEAIRPEAIRPEAIRPENSPRPQGPRVAANPVGPSPVGPSPVGPSPVGPEIAAPQPWGDHGQAPPGAEPEIDEARLVELGLIPPGGGHLQEAPPREAEIDEARLVELGLIPPGDGEGAAPRVVPPSGGYAHAEPLPDPLSAENLFVTDIEAALPPGLPRDAFEAALAELQPEGYRRYRGLVAEERDTLYQLYLSTASTPLLLGEIDRFYFRLVPDLDRRGFEALLRERFAASFERYRQLRADQQARIYSLYRLKPERRAVDSAIWLAHSALEDSGI